VHYTGCSNRAITVKNRRITVHYTGCSKRAFTVKVIVKVCCMCVCVLCFWQFVPALPRSRTVGSHITRQCSVSSLELEAEPRHLSRYSDWLRAGRPRARSLIPGGVRNFYSCLSFGPALRPTQAPVEWIPGGKTAGA
jgi:hypothetical protein